VENARGSVVHIRAVKPVVGGTSSILPGETTGAALGSGFVIQIEKRILILTNEHVLQPAIDFRVVTNDGSEIKAQIVGRDPTLDVALLEVPATSRLQPLRLGRSDQLRVGEWVLAVGNPFGDEVTASAGIVSSLGSSASELDRPRISPRGFLQIDANIHAGNSGGPLLNMAGEVVGINNALEARPGPIGFALPIDKATQVLPILSTSGHVSRPWLGLKVLPVEPQVAAAVKLEPPRGALVSEVVAGPALRAGLQRGDVILRFDRRAVDHKTLPGMVAASGFEPREIVIWREGSEKTLTITPEKMAN
jgi:serine protease Do